MKIWINKKYLLSGCSVLAAGFLLISCGNNDDNKDQSPVKAAASIKEPISASSKEAAIKDAESRRSELHSRIATLNDYFANDKDPKVHEVVDKQINVLREHEQAIANKLEDLKKSSSANFVKEKEAFDGSTVAAANDFEALDFKRRGIEDAKVRFADVDKNMTDHAKLAAADTTGSTKPLIDQDQKDFQTRVQQIKGLEYDLKLAPLDKAKPAYDALVGALDTLNVDIKARDQEVDNQNKIKNDIQKINAEIDRVKTNLRDAPTPDRKTELQTQVQQLEKSRDEINQKVQDWTQTKVKSERDSKLGEVRGLIQNLKNTLKID